MAPTILAFAGSTRKASFNRRLLAIAAAGAREAGASVTVIELADYPLPIMNQDLEEQEGLPENAIKLKDLFLAHQGLLTACPEYNSSITPLWKNTIDWVSRPRAGEGRLACFSGKVAGLVSASPSALGGMRGLVHVRQILSNIGTLVLPEQATVAKANEAFEGDELTDTALRDRVKQVGHRLADATARHARD